MKMYSPELASSTMALVWDSLSLFYRIRLVLRENELLFSSQSAREKNGMSFLFYLSCEIYPKI